MRALLLLLPAVVLLLLHLVHLSDAGRRRGAGRGVATAGRRRDSSSSSNSTAAEQERLRGRMPRVFNLLQVIRFENDPCPGSAGMTGTCYTEAECQDRNGANSGTCAAGFGVCCVFTIGCGGMSNENCTFFAVSNTMDGGCSATICPCNSDICQLRLDFIDFTIAGPSMMTESVFKTLNNDVTDAAGVPSSLASRCLIDNFSVSNPDGGTAGPPTICGNNVGQHMYVDASDDCNDLDFVLGAPDTGARSWNIKVTQYSCGFDNLAPPGCTQWFFNRDSNEGSVQTFNFDGGAGQHLADQNQVMCIRRERGNCRLCFVSTDATFDISGTAAATKIVDPDICCNYETIGVNAGGYDCVTLPGGVNGAGAEAEDRRCGRQYVATRCTVLEPFLLRFMSDSFETVIVNADPAIAAKSESAQLDEGLMLNYFMDAINCDVFA